MKKNWKWISTRGFRDGHFRANGVTSAMNRMTVLTALIAGLFCMVSIAVGCEIEYILFTGITAFLYLLVFCMNWAGCNYIARFAIIFFTVLWVDGTTIAIGGNLSQSIVIATVLGVSFSVFKKQHKTRMAVLAAVILTHSATLAYMGFHEPLFGTIDYPLDEVGIFLLSAGWCCMLFVAHHKEKMNFIGSLKEKNKELADTAEELERFTYIASHDLKSPLRTIISFIGLLERDISKNRLDNLQERLDFIKSGAHQMNYLITDILELSKFNHNPKKEKEWVDFNRLIKKVKFNLHDEIKEKNVIINCDSLPFYFCHESAFLIVFQNIIQNGIKYNESKNPIISIKCIKNHHQYILDFEDNGIGISKEYQKDIFQFFKRLHTSEKYQGTGLGLGLVKKIITTEGGSIYVNSDEGHGSIFTIELPQNNQPENKGKLLLEKRLEIDTFVN